METSPVKRKVRKRARHRDITRWVVHDVGDLNVNTARDIEYTCMNCMNDAALPVNGLVLAQHDSALVFDVGGHAMPDEIQCPKCLHIYGLAKPRGA